MSFGIDDGAGSFNPKDNRGGQTNPFAAAYIPDRSRQP